MLRAQSEASTLSIGLTGAIAPALCTRPATKVVCSLMRQAAVAIDVGSDKSHSMLLEPGARDAKSSPIPSSSVDGRASANTG